MQDERVLDTVVVTIAQDSLNYIVKNGYAGKFYVMCILIIFIIFLVYVYFVSCVCIFLSMCIFLQFKKLGGSMNRKLAFDCISFCFKRFIYLF